MRSSRHGTGRRRSIEMPGRPCNRTRSKDAMRPLAQPQAFQTLRPC
jgi:hypothetical protein